MSLRSLKGVIVENYVVPILMACPFCNVDWYRLRIEYDHQAIIEYKCSACSKHFRYYKAFGKIVEQIQAIGSTLL
jgi:transposase-like protein